MVRSTFGLLTSLLMAASAPCQELKIDIPHQKFVFSNGLTLIVHEDHKALIVAVNIWYHVGSKNEHRGRTGFAHLFEHLMFNGTEHFNQDYFKVLEKIGATDLNGTTNNDRTNYFQNVPVSALDTVLWMESDRMGHLLGVIDKARLDEQRGVVQNEKRQGENQPYGRAQSMIAEATYPPQHPYSWSVIGSMEDLNAASLEDVREWFRTYYGPSNATLVIAGDIDPATARAKVEKYFGDIPPGPPLSRHAAWVAKRSGAQRQVMEDRVPQYRIYKVWNTPQAFTAEADYLSLAAAVLGGAGGGGRGARGGGGGTRTARLYRRLVYQDQIATSASAFQSTREIAGQFSIVADVRPGVDPARVEKAIEEELARFLAEGPTAEELDRIKTASVASSVRGLERIGGFGGKSDTLASGQVYAGNPEAFKQTFERYQTATAEQVKHTANAWLSDGVFTLEVRPFGSFKPVQVSVDRSRVPDAGTPPEAKLPKLLRATLSNGLKLVLAERHEIPVVTLEMLVDAGEAAETRGGAAALTASMLLQGTTTRDALGMGEQAQGLGAQLGAASGLDTTTISLSALKNKLDESLSLWADMILNPAFDARELARLQKQTAAGIARAKTSPDGAAARVFPAMVYGTRHPYGVITTEKDVMALNRDSLVEFHRTWFKPNNAVLAVVGDTTLAELQPRLEKLFASWRQGGVPARKVPAAGYPEKSVVYLVDRPGAQQSVVTAGHVAPARNNPEEIAIEALNGVLGGAFTSRVNMNIREEKHWSYGARTSVSGGTNQRLFAAHAPVQTDKTKETMIELKKEFTEILSTRPVTADELARVRDQRALRIPGQFETASAVLASIADIVRNRLPDDFYDTYAARIRALKTSDLNTAAEKLIKPDRMVWVVVGDRAKIEAGIRELQYGEVRVVDADGNPAN